MKKSNNYPHLQKIQVFFIITWKYEYKINNVLTFKIAIRLATTVA